MQDKSILRASVRTMYDLQKMRIQAGNRIVAAFRTKLGIEPGKSEKDSPTEAKKLLQQLRKEYRRITDGVKRITRDFKPDSDILTSSGEVALIQAYEQQLESERMHHVLIEIELGRFPVWTEYLSKIRGVGPLMAGVIVSEIDIHKCNSISALWAYAGLDVVVYRDPETGEIKEEGRSMRRHHLVPKKYVDSDGNVRETVGISFNPFLKTKLIGVLGSIFIKIGSPYRDIYDDYKHRLENHPKHKDKTKGHRHNMAVRYMIKEFLADLWREWRILEGLPVRPRYSEEKLGIVHSHDVKAA